MNTIKHIMLFLSLMTSVTLYREVKPSDPYGGGRLISGLTNIAAFSAIVGGAAFIAFGIMLKYKNR